MSGLVQRPPGRVAQWVTLPWFFSIWQPRYIGKIARPSIFPALSGKPEGQDARLFARRSTGRCAILPRSVFGVLLLICKYSRSASTKSGAAQAVCDFSRAFGFDLVVRPLVVHRLRRGGWVVVNVVNVVSYHG